MSATVHAMPSDPFEKLSASTVAETLTAKGWPGVSTNGDGVVVDLGAVVALVVTGRLGEQALQRLVGVHGALPPAPKYAYVPRDGEPRALHFFRAPPDVRIPSAANLHGAVPGVSILASGREALPPATVEMTTYIRWQRSAHAATTPLRPLPRWLCDLAADPAAAHRAWGAARPAEPGVADEWRRELTLRAGVTESTYANTCTILRHAPQYSGRIAFDDMSASYTLDGRAIDEGLTGHIRERLERDWNVKVGSDVIGQAVANIARDNHVHPVRDYLSRLEWDGEKRLDSVASRALGATAPLATKMVRAWFISAVARALRPGCKADCALVLQGSQGARKSTFFSALAGEWFCDSHVDLSNKDAYLQLSAAWIIEWGEIERVTSRKGADEVKSFMSSRVDTYRRPYAKNSAPVPRTCVIVGSTNQEQFLDDDTGSRRFWIVRVPGVVDHQWTLEHRDQLWAEAVAAFRADEHWWLDDSDEAARAADADRHATEDPWSHPILAWTDKQDGNDFTAGEVLSGALDVPKRDHDQRRLNRVAKVLRLAGWERRKHRPLRDGVTGAPTWCWFRPTPTAPKIVEVPF